MSDNKKYYYMKLKEDFFDTDEIKILEGLKDGVLYSNILLKLYLRSLKNEGLLMMNEFIPYNAEMISTITRQPVGVVNQALTIFKSYGLIEVFDNGAIYMNNIQLFIGKSSTEGERKKLARLRAKELNGQVSDKRPPEIELEIELEIDKYSANAPTFDKSKAFDAFWKLYPRKVNKKKARDKFYKVCKDENMFEKIMKGVMNYKLTKQWQTIELIPHPTTWLNGEQWEDEIITASNPKNTSFDDIDIPDDEVTF